MEANTHYRELDNQFGASNVKLILTQAGIIGLEDPAVADVLPPSVQEWMATLTTPQDYILPSSYLILKLGLNRDTPDSKNLVDRLVFPEVVDEIDALNAPLVQMRLTALNKAIGITIANLPEEKTASNSTEAITHNLSKVLERQLIREGNICPRTLSYAAALAIKRPMYFTDDGKIALRQAIPNLMI
jgi:hypothetical protein